MQILPDIEDAIRISPQALGGFTSRLRRPPWLQIPVMVIAHGGFEVWFSILIFNTKSMIILLQKIEIHTVPLFIS